MALAVMALTAGCSAGRIRRDNALALTAADARVLAGCYDCLIEARDAYARLATARHVQADTILLRLFEVELLIALREKELQLDWEPALARARLIAARLPASFGGPRVMAIADAVLPDGTGRMGDWPVELRRRTAGVEQKVAAEVMWLDTVPIRSQVRSYLALALDCSHGGRVLAPTRTPGAPHRRPVLAPDATPLTMYRTAICLGTDTVMLQAVRAHVPRFAEAAFFIGGLAAFAAEETGGADAEPLFAEAYARFPRSPSVTYMRGWLGSNTGDCPAAVSWFDSTLAIDASHELAWLQRTVCLSTLKRDSIAIESASRLIALGTGLAGQAHYWRAVSQLRLRNLPAARADIEVAKRQARGPNSLTIAGIIEHDQDDLAIAEADLMEARGALRGDENCTAAWYLGLVFGKQQRAKESAAGFEAAMQCYDVRVADARYRIGVLERRPTRHPQVRARRIAALVADSVDNRSRYFASAFNAAGHLANAGDRARALQLLAIAASDPKLAEPVTRLRAAITAAR
jgi:hypothetical protein